MSEEYENIYFKRLAQIVATAPKVGNSYLYITKIKCDEPGNQNSRNLEKELNQN